MVRGSNNAPGLSHGRSNLFFPYKARNFLRWSATFSDRVKWTSKMLKMALKAQNCDLTNISTQAINNQVLGRSRLRLQVKFVDTRLELCQVRVNKF